MSELQKWAETPNDKLYEYAKGWAKRFKTRHLRGFQAHYDKLMAKTINEVEYKGLSNMWWCATWAISIREFGE